jgi:hypothetical protein
MHSLAAEFSAALGRAVRYVDVPFDKWREALQGGGLPEHTFQHVVTMAQLHAANRYDRLTHDVEKITGRPATSVRDFVTRHVDQFKPDRPT